MVDNFEWRQKTQHLLCHHKYAIHKDMLNSNRLPKKKTKNKKQQTI